MNNFVLVDHSKQASFYKHSAIFISVWLVLWVLVFWAALSSAVHVWWESDTFNHCFFVLPVSVYFIWQQRGAIFTQPPKINWLGFLAALFAIALAMLGQAADIKVFQHVGSFSLLPIISLAFLGWRVVTKITIPLFLMLFAIPLGEELIPALQEVTADIAMWFLQLTSIPVYRDALYFTIPNGRFVVAEACSGISFFIACVVIGVCYAYLSFVQVWRAIFFVLISLVLPIVANGIRVFGIIVIGYKTNMEYAVGADHIIYGGVFFAVVIILLLIIGYFLSDGQRVWQNKIEYIHPGWFVHFNIKNGLIVLVPLLLAGLITVKLNSPDIALTFNLAALPQQNVTQQESYEITWSPRFRGADYYYADNKIVNNKAVNLYKAVYQTERDGVELISSANRLYDIKAWALDSTYYQYIEDLGNVDVFNLKSSSGKQRLLAFWYVLPATRSSDRRYIKMQQALNRLSGLPQGGAVIAVSMAYSVQVEVALLEMQEILNTQANIWGSGLQLHQ